jgi:hypothetical protein
LQILFRSTDGERSNTHAAAVPGAEKMLISSLFSEKVTPRAC